MIFLSSCGTVIPKSAWTIELIVYEITDSFLENMTEEYPSLSSHKSRSWSEWINCVENSDLLLGNGNQEEYGNTLLPRQDITLYGIYPKMESRVFVMCKECSKVIRSNGIKSHLLHCHTNKKIEEQASIDISGSSNAIKKKSSHSKSKKKCVLPKNVPLSPLFPKTGAPPSQSVPLPVDVPPPVLQPIQVEPTTPSPQTDQPITTVNSRHKKPKKQGSSKALKEHENEKIRNALNNKTVSLKQLSSSNHQGPVKKPTPARSKNVHHNVPDAKTTKESSKTPLSGLVQIAPKVCPENNSNVVLTESTAVTTSSITTKIIPKVITTTVEATASNIGITTPNALVKPVTKVCTTPTENKVAPPEVTISKDNTSVSTVPIVLMPMSPVAVISPVQLIQLGVPVLHLSSPQQVPSPLPAQPIIVSISDQPNNIKLYDTHPKPLIMPTMATRKIGGAILLQNQRLGRQRKDTDVAINCESISLLNTMHKPNIIKCKSVKMNNKRPAIDKLVSSDCKQTRLTPDVNGFILHADVSETAEAPQPSNSIHEKIALLNMK